MSDLLTAALLAALSVSKLEAELDSREYTVEVLGEALVLEHQKDDPRKTAIEAIDRATEEAVDRIPGAISRDEAEALLEEAAQATVYKVPKGKSMTTRAGMKSEGQEVTAKMVTGGVDKLKLLKSKGLLV